MGADPVGQRLRPARLGIGEIGSAQDGDENLRQVDLAGEPVNDHWHRVAACMSLPHRHRQSRARRSANSNTSGWPSMYSSHSIARVTCLRLELAVDLGPIGLDVAAMTLLG